MPQADHRHMKKLSFFFSLFLYHSKYYYQFCRRNKNILVYYLIILSFFRGDNDFSLVLPFYRCTDSIQFHLQATIESMDFLFCFKKNISRNIWLKSEFVFFFKISTNCSDEHFTNKNGKLIHWNFKLTYIRIAGVVLWNFVHYCFSRH